jgi:hypothetical protein
LPYACVTIGEQVQAQPDQGFVHWVRAIGADDEPERLRERR